MRVVSLDPDPCTFQGIRDILPRSLSVKKIGLGRCFEEDCFFELCFGEIVIS